MRMAVLSIVFLLFIGTAFFLYQQRPIISPIGKPSSQVIKKPLEKYSFPNLIKTDFPPSNITLGRVIASNDTFTSQAFYYKTTEPSEPGKIIADESQWKKVSGLINVPKDPGTYPVIVMFRGFVPLNIFAPGVGTQPVGQVLASHGFITLAPDFLGYGESDPASNEAFENRFQTYTTALSLLSSLSTLNSGLDASYSGSIRADLSKVGIWGHSNGGHITLSVLSITGKSYPTVLWNPVSMEFPLSILAYTDESADHGKSLISLVSQFEKTYNAEDFSPPNFYSRITAPIQLHQGEADQEVWPKWSYQLYYNLNKMGKDITYYTYPGADHNMDPSDQWSQAVERSLQFYQNEFKTGQ